MGRRPEHDNDPITLKEACEIVFRNTVTPATLRAEAGRGRIEIARIGKRDFTTLRSARELFERCRVEREAQGSISTPSGKLGQSGMVCISSARAALPHYHGRRACGVTVELREARWFRR